MLAVKSRLNGLEEENKTLKARSTAVTLETIEKENQQLKGQMYEQLIHSKTTSYTHPTPTPTHTHIHTHTASS